MLFAVRSKVKVVNSVRSGAVCAWARIPFEFSVVNIDQVVTVRGVDLTLPGQVLWCLPPVNAEHTSLCIHS